MKLLALVAVLAAALPDRGIWPDLDHGVALSPATDLGPAAQVRLLVDKRHRILTVLDGDTPIRAYPIALGTHPEGDKERQGDGRTPEGEYRIVESLTGPGLPAKYGAASLKLSYPADKDARRGLSRGLITRAQHDAIRAALARGPASEPPQDTPLGGSIRIHGGGIGADWTLGCIALRDPDVLELAALARPGTVVSVSASRPPGLRDRDDDGIADELDVLLGAKKTLLQPSQYRDRYVTLAAHGGDVPRTEGVCTDVVVRALRNAGIDLQEALQRDAAQAPSAYPRIGRRDPNIDHRRVKNLERYFARHFAPVPDASALRPGDVLFLDTLSGRTGADHVGVVSDRPGPRGRPLVINHWTVGYQVEEMDLLPDIRLVAAYRVRPVAQGR